MKINKELFLIDGNFIGICKKCGEPTIGEYDCNEDGIIQMECVSCHWVKLVYVDTGKKKVPAKKKKCGKMEVKKD
jgi:hypothetical protein